ncbi:HutD/Ves family protein [Comamonas sp. 4034]|uniref:HutD/Ves family protein n=1 Tax=Comamonas sp. 4034 TaxID=3156455 RepID=UPI003D1B33E4
MHRFDLNEITPRPWKNGGGSTREIACWPQGADMDSFGWRVSIATVAQAGPFSAFPGIDRQIMLLDGDGVQLIGAAAGIHHTLQQQWQPYAFSGDAALECSMLGGTCTDFNVMTRRGQWSAEVLIQGTEIQPGHSAAGLCMVLQGSFLHGDALLHTGQGLLWWDMGDEQTRNTAPLLPRDADSRLVLVSLTQATR